jgi:hypothetical protein
VVGRRGTKTAVLGQAVAYAAAAAMDDEVVMIGQPNDMFISNVGLFVSVVWCGADFDCWVFVTPIFLFSFLFYVRYSFSYPLMIYSFGS